MRQTYATHNGNRFGILSDTSAMSCPSFSLPAGYACPGAPSGEGSPCEGCYAQQGMYGLDSTATAQWARYHWTKDSLATNPQEWVDTMVGAIESASKGGFFRWHDSGDIFSPKYAKAIGEVIAHTPHIRHWIPTQSHRVAAIRKAIEKHILPHPNVVVRPSTPLMDAEPTPQEEGWAAGSTVYNPPMVAAPHGGVLVCPKSVAPHKGASCEGVGCRVCWMAPFQGVAYQVHGVAGKHVLTIVSDKVKNKRDAQKTANTPQ